MATIKSRPGPDPVNIIFSLIYATLFEPLFLALTGHVID